MTSVRSQKSFREQQLYLPSGAKKPQGKKSIPKIRCRVFRRFSKQFSLGGLYERTRMPPPESCGDYRMLTAASVGRARAARTAAALGGILYGCGASASLASEGGASFYIPGLTL